MQVSIGRCQDSHINGNGRVAADAGDLALFEHAQQTHLGSGGHFANFIEKNGAPLCLFKDTLVAFFGIGKSAFLVTKELVFQQVFRYSSTVDWFERLVARVL